jgi:hypothetical protein
MTRIRPSFAIIALLAVLVPGSAQAQAPPAQKPPSLKNLKLEFDIVRAELLIPLADLDELYAVQLEKLRLETQNRGQLEQVIAVRAEQARLEGKNPEAAGEEFPELEKIRSIYARTKSDRLLAMNRALLPVVEQQKSVLEKLRIAQTQSNQIDEAILTQAEYERVVALETAIRKELAAPASPVASVTAPSTSSPTVGATALKIRVQVDGLGHLHLRGGEIWFDHSRGRASAPGRHEGEHPTYLNDKTEWRPVWSGNVTQHYAAGIALPTQGNPATLHVRQSGGRGHAVVLQQPNSTNGYTAIIELRDQTEDGRAFNGSDWLEFRLSW